MRWVLVVLSMIVLLAVGPLVMAVDRGLQLDARWYDAGRESAGLAPDPAEQEAALVQVYAARAFGWRGILGAHTWIAVKDRSAKSYRLLQVTRWSGGVSFSNTSLPDRAWFGNELRRASRRPRGVLATLVLPVLVQPRLLQLALGLSRSLLADGAAIATLGNASSESPP